MPEIKRTFTAGKMNKDLDERLVRNGEYRDALNIQVRTTDGDGTGIGNAGVVQNLKGNRIHSRAYRNSSYNPYEGSPNEAQPYPAIYTKFVGSVSDEKNDKAYFFAAAPLEGTLESIPYTDIMNYQSNSAQTSATIIADLLGDNLLEEQEIDQNSFDPSTTFEHAQIQGPILKHWIDSIIEVDATINSTGNTPLDGYGTPIFVDKFGVTGRWFDVLYDEAFQPPTSGFGTLTVLDGSAYRIGMIMYLYDDDGQHQFYDADGGYGVEIVDIQNNTLVFANVQSVDLQEKWNNGDITWQSAIKFIHPERVLEFDYNTLIPNINIIDNLIFYTDSINEPKKINITRSKKGTIVDAMENYPNIEQTAESYLENPKHTKLFVNNTNITGISELVLASELEWSLKTSDIKKEHITVIRKAPITAPHLKMSDTTRNSEVNFVITDLSMIPEGELNIEFGDIKIITNDAFIPIDIKVNDVLRFTNAENTANPASVTARVISYDQNSPTIELQIIFASEDLGLQDPTMWNVALEQDEPLFETKFGRVAYRYQYEDNEYSSFSPWSELAFLPSNFLYSAKNGFNEGMSNKIRKLVIEDFIPDDSIRPSDVKKIDILWKTTDDQSVYVVKSVTRNKDLEWNPQANENTGTLLMTSEMIHRVLASSQALRSWDNVPKKALTQEITGSRLVYGNYTQGYDINNVVSLSQTILSQNVAFPTPQKSVKSIRSYKWGVVFGDKYGRETPVIAQGASVDMGQPSDITVEKSLAHLSNKFKLTQVWDNEPETWMEYAKYYIKETSNEYYNLVLDRWYDAGDGTIWLSFPSVDRNKVDEETYLILKNEHGSQNPVIEKARYKILAIENEAPDYIKTDYRPMAKVKISLQGLYGPSGATADGIPIALIDTIEIRTSDTAWDDIPIEMSKFKGTPRVRIVAEKVANTATRAESPWRTVSRIHTPEAAGTASRGCDIKESWEGTEVNLFTQLFALDNTIEAANVDDVSNASYLQYYMEFRDEVVENKPEFDGRFFAKIDMDDMLSEKVVVSPGNMTYSVLQTYQISYIAAKKYHPAENLQTGIPQYWADGDTSGYGGWTAGTIETTQTGIPIYIGGGDEYNTLNPTGIVPAFGPGNNTLTEQFWNTWYYDPNGGGTTKIFIDEAPARHGFNIIVEVPYAGWTLEGEDLSLTGGEDLSELVPNLSENVANYSLPMFLGAIAPNDYDESSPISILQPTNTIQTKGGWTMIPGYYDLLTAEGLYRNWRQNGLSRGHATTSTLGQLTLSVVGDESLNQDWANLKTSMQTPGTFFRFQDDPNGCVYKVIQIHWMVIDNAGDEVDMEWYGTVNIPKISNHTYGLDIVGTDDPTAKRSSIITRFIRVDLANGAEMYDNGDAIGLHPGEWDPRGTVQHNGIGSMAIQILDQVNTGGLIEDEIVTDKACFETEPKKNIDIDIYYEASNAIPMKLNTEGNIKTFTKPSIRPSLAGYVNILPRNYSIQADTDGDGIIDDNIPFVENVNISPTARVYSTINNNVIDVRTGYTGNITPPNIETTFIEDDEGNPDFGTGAKSIATGIAIDDLITFTHPNGLITQSKVLDHMEPVLFNSNIVTADLSERTTRFGIPIQYNIGGNNYGIFYYEGYDTLASSLIGWEAKGANVEKGTFVADYNIIPTGGGGYTTFIVLSKDLSQNYSVLQTFQFIKTTGYYKIEAEVWQYPIELNWFNCYSFGNGVESDRIRDDFNAPQIDNGFKASSTFLDYKEETIGSGLIHSSELYNAISSINGLNEFSMAQKITKNLNPIYGSIQALKTRDTDLVTFCEDKVLKVLANKDALFNTDGSKNLTATNKVLGTAMPFAGEYGISKNPESLAVDQYRMYFSDKQRGAVLRLSQDGLTPISSVGMKTWFRENLIDCDTIVGNFDWENGEYNITLDFNEASEKELITVSFNEGSKGWVSFKSFIPNCGLSISGKYFTAPNDTHRHSLSARGTHWIYQHGLGSRNNFYSNFYNSEIEILFNDLPDVVKSFRAMNYEGSQGRVIESTNLTIANVSDVLGNSVSTADNEYYNLEQIDGWYLSTLDTDMQTGTIKEFIEKENKWFNRITNISSPVDEQVEELFVQGIGFPSLIGATPSPNPETQTDGDIIIETEPEIVTLNANSVEYTIWSNPINNTYAIIVNQIGNMTGATLLSNSYNFYLSQNPQDGSPNVPISTNEVATFGLSAGYYSLLVSEIDDSSNATLFAIVINEDVTYPLVQEVETDIDINTG